jgi:hypothetical protein
MDQASLGQVTAEPQSGQSQGTPETLSPVETIERYLKQQSGEQQVPEEQQTEGEQDAEAEESDAEQSDTESAEDEAKRSVDIDPDAKVFEIEGEKLSLNDLKSQRMMQADYSKKTAELARQREQLPQEVQKQVQPVVEQYANNMRIMQRAVWDLANKEIANVDWNTLAEENPAEFVRMSAKAQQVNNVLAAAQEELSNAQQAEAELQAKQRRQEIQESLQQLPKVIPGWDDGTYRQVINEGAKLYGFDPETIAAVTDWKVIAALHDAVKYKQLQDNKTLAQKKVVSVPKMLKPGAAQPAPNQGEGEIKQLKTKARQSGSKEDAVALVQRLMRGK